MIKDVEPLLKECEETLAELRYMGEMNGACYVQGFINSINKLPNVEKPHGVWEAIYFDNMPMLWACSECKNRNTWPSPFCPSCGASMVKEGKDELNLDSYSWVETDPFINDIGAELDGW